MKEQIRLFKKLILIFVPVLTLIIMFELKARNLPNGFTMKKNLLENNAEYIDLLVLGSSYGYDGINPEVISKKSFNLAINNQDLYYDVKLFDKYKHKMVNLKCVIMTLTNFSFWFDVNNSPEKWRKYFYKEIFQIQPKSPMSISDIMDLKSYSFAFFYGFYNTLLGTVDPSLFQFGVDMNSYGWNIDTGRQFWNPKESLFEHGKERVDFTNTLMTEGNIEYNIILLKEMIEYTKEKNIKLILVSTPVSYPFFKYMDKSRYNEFQNAVYAFENHQNVIYLNYNSDARFLISDFRDYDHVSGSGAFKLSCIIRDTLESLKFFKAE